MNALIVVSYLAYLAISALIALRYYCGWRRLAASWPELFTRQRLLLFIAGICLFAIVVSPPVTILAGYYLSVRSVQKVLVSMIIPPMIWSSLPLHAIIASFSYAQRKTLTQWFVRTPGDTHSHRLDIFAIFAQPGIVWLSFICVFSIWHEPSLANWLVSHMWVNNLFIGLLLLVSLLFWSQIVGTLPRIGRKSPGWSLLITLVAVEIPNMAAGITVAFANEPIYQHYVDIRQAGLQDFVQNGSLANHNFWLTVVGDQRLSGCITWIVGTLVYVTAIMSVLHKLFSQEKGLPPVLDLSRWADERTIAPGLEYRVQQNHWQQANKQTDAK